MTFSTNKTKGKEAIYDYPLSKQSREQEEKKSYLRREEEEEKRLKRMSVASKETTGQNRNHTTAG